MTFHANSSIMAIKNEVRHLVNIGSLDPQQAIYSLSQFFSAGDWALVECELEENGYSLMTNCIDDILM
ncbi:MAG: DUF4327 family protein [Cyanobacteria bacterium P01_G01_bin.67]